MTTPDLVIYHLGELIGIIINSALSIGITAFGVWCVVNGVIGIGKGIKKLLK